jgi:tRNA(Ser,Leu) C12 N-acetylase TAN1
MPGARHGGARRSDGRIVDLLVSHLRGYFGFTRKEVARVLARFGDDEPSVEKSGIPGICVVHTRLDNREVVARCKALHREAPATFRFAIKWVPVDFWCAKDLDTLVALIGARVAPRIAPHETWALDVERRDWDAHPSAEIVGRLAAAVDRAVQLKAPDCRVHVDVLRDVVAVSVLKRGEVFSVHASAPERVAAPLMPSVARVLPVE